MKTLITGGAGLIGSNLVEYFLGKGEQVVCLDNFAIGFKHNIEPIFGRNHECDIPHSQASIEKATPCVIAQVYK
jgi:nucleoside-diphosphate-sugar epimerase